MPEEAAIETAPEAPVETQPTETPAEGTPEPQEDYSNFLLEEEPEDPAAPATPEAPQAPAPNISSILPKDNAYITSAEQMQGAVADATYLYDVVAGKQNAASLLGFIAQNNPDAARRMANELAPLIEQMTGRKFEGEHDPTSLKLQELDQRQRNFNEQQQQEAFQRRAQAIQPAVMKHLATRLKDSVFEGEEQRILEAVSARVGLSPEQRVAAIERGDFSSIDKALKEIRREERENFNARVKRLSEQRKRKAAALPRGGSGSAGETKGTPRYTPETIRDPKVFQQWMKEVSAGTAPADLT